MNTTVRFVDRITTVRFPTATPFTQAQFNSMMDVYNAALQPFLSNEAAYAVLGAGKEFVFAQGSQEAQQGIKAVTYAP